MSNSLRQEGDDENLGRNANWEAQVKMLKVKSVTRKCISQ